MKPVVDRLRTRYAGRVDIQRLGTDKGDPQVASLAQTFGVEYLPTFVFVDADGTVLDTVVGSVPEATLTSEIARLK